MSLFIYSQYIFIWTCYQDNSMSEKKILYRREKNYSEITKDNYNIDTLIKVISIILASI